MLPKRELQTLWHALPDDDNDEIQSAADPELCQFNLIGQNEKIAFAKENLCNEPEIAFCKSFMKKINSSK